MKYFDDIQAGVEKAYSLARQARTRGFDPEDDVAIPLAANMAERVEGLISVVEPAMRGSGISERIEELEKEYGKLSWKVALTIAREVAQGTLAKIADKRVAMEVGIRVGLAYLTLGVVASPIEGFVELRLKKRRDDGKEYFCLMFSGPIRSAGGTAAAVSVIVADHVRKEMGYAPYDPSDDEVKRTVTEVYDYHERITNLQYLPSEDELTFLAQHLPVQIDGDASERIEVSNYKDLSRIEANRIRNGFCLVMAECLSQKAPKLWNQLRRWGDDFGLGDWVFLKDFVKLQKTKKAKAAKSEGGISPDFTFIKDLVAGRPILGFPMRQGGFRLRYGRARTSGYSSAAIHPATMRILDKFIAIGTQLKMERPGKAASISTCDSVEGPIVRLRTGEVLRVQSLAKAMEVAKEVEEIVYLGDILINYGDFVNRAHKLIPPGYCEEWWAREIEKALAEGKTCAVGKDRLESLVAQFVCEDISVDEALAISEGLDVPLHPRYTYYWDALTPEEAASALGDIAKARRAEGKLIMHHEEGRKRRLELLGVPHTLATEYIVVKGGHARMLEIIAEAAAGKKLEAPVTESLATHLPFALRERGGIFIGARMGRPEKAKVRKMDGQPHCLFPVGDEGGRLRSFQAAMQVGRVTSDFPLYVDDQGGEHVFKTGADGTPHQRRHYNRKNHRIEEKAIPEVTVPFSRRGIDIVDIFKRTVAQIGIKQVPELVKGVRGTSNREHVPEHLAKGILRAVHSVPVNKDGTTRYDMTQLAITHFTPAEVETSVARLKEMGYVDDSDGKPLERDDQVLELFPQDIILPGATETAEDPADEVLFRCANFVDDLLVRLYGGKPYYRLKKKRDLVGHLVLALAPHTSAAIAARIVGFSKTQGFYAHPMLHAATRRDCDGDEACVTLLLDALLNFSRQYLPNSRGATQDAPLVLTSRLAVSEVDDMVFDLDIASRYPLEFYEACLRYADPKEVDVETVGDRLGTGREYRGTSYTHPVSDMSLGVRCSSYKLLPTMQEKLKGQMDLAFKIRAVDEAEVAKIVIEKHFIKDIKGNLRKFSMQQFRCVACNEKFRRPPLRGSCTKCQGKIIFTISEGSIVKYLEPALSLAEHYHLPAYLRQTLELTKRRVESIFGKDPEKQEGLGKWF